MLVVVLFVFSSMLADASPGNRRIVRLSGARSAGTVQVAGRTVPDLAVADRLLVGVRSRAGKVCTAAVSVSQIGGQVERSLGDGRLLVVDLPKDSDILEIAEGLKARPDIEFAEPDRVVYSTVIPDDPEYANQPHLPKIVCAPGWDIGTGSKDVIIAIVDSGIDTDHPDLADRLWTNPNEVANGQDDDDGPYDNKYVDDLRGWDFYDNDNDPEAIPNGIDEDHDGTPDEQVNHGTLAAGLAAAAANGFGAVGVSWNATIMPLKIFGSDGTTLVSTVVEAMYYAARKGAHIVNLSIGAPYEQSFTGPIVELWNRGGLTVAAGGNDGDEIRDRQSTWSSPTCNNGPNPLADNMVLGVGGLTYQDRKASWSNYDGSTKGDFVEVFAPGINVYGPGVYFPSMPAFNTYFTSKSGTSFAAPLVSGLAALLKAQDMSRTGADLIQIIRSNCDNIDALNPGYVGKLGAGRINVARALGADLPVAAPTDVAAADTAGDQGGSITVTWIKSVDDGAGANTVIGYAVSRAQGALPAQVAPADAAWEEIASLPAGSAQYVDEGVDDGIAYYYRVAAVAATSRNESDPVGPVFSFDDSAPPRIETLSVQDHPFDNGQAIDLDWTGYTGSQDLIQFRIYRDSRPFSSVLGMMPLTTLSNPDVRSYTDTPTADGVDYHYAVTALDGLGNERKDVLDAGPVQSFANGPVTLASGLHMMGPLAVPADEHPATLFGIPASQLNYARYNTALGAYDVYGGEPIAEPLKLRLGQGFWIRFDTPLTFTPSGTTVPAGNLDIDVAAGWHQLANPFFGAMDFSATTVTYNGNTMDLTSADTLDIARSYAWKYNRLTGDYEVLHPLIGTGTTVEPWEALWVLIEKPCTLTLARPTGTTSVQSRGEPPATTQTGEWLVQLVARGAGSVDAANYCGVSTAPSGIQSPPRAVSGVDLYFVDSVQTDSGARYATAFEASAGTEMSWEFELAWDGPQDSVSIAWPDLSRVPAGYSLTLRDRDSGRAVSMRHQTGYTVRATSATGVRHFTVEATKSPSGSVQITSLAARPASGGAQVVFALSRAAACTVEVMNIAGRRVSTVENGGVRAAGANSVVWTGRNSSGARVPSGQYLVRIKAQAEDGTTTSALRSVRIRR